MARLDWAFVCDLAYFDRQDRLCVVGVAETITLPRLPMALAQLTVVAHLVDLQPTEELDIAVAIVTPSGVLQQPADDDGVAIEVVQHHVVATLRFVPFREPGTYRFQIAINEQSVAIVDVPVLAPVVTTGVH